MLYLVALLLPPIGILLAGKPFQAILALILMVTIIGWPIAAIWAVLVVHNHYADDRTKRIVEASQATAAAQAQAASQAQAAAAQAQAAAQAAAAQAAAARAQAAQAAAAQAPAPATAPPAGTVGPPPAVTTPVAASIEAGQTPGGDGTNAS